MPSIPPPSRARAVPPPRSATLTPWRKTRPPINLPVHNRPTSFRGHIQSVHHLKPSAIVEKPSKKFDCPPAPICTKNCGISIDENGCQSCKCLWLSACKLNA